jgi:hypothetical protein
MMMIFPSPRRRPRRRRPAPHRTVGSLLLAAGALALAGCETMPGGLPQRPSAGAPAPPAPGADLPAAAGQPGGQGQPGQPGQQGQQGQQGPAVQPPPSPEPATPPPAQPPAAPERTVALLGTRQLRCADPGPQAQDPQQVHSEAFRDAAQWRAYLAAVDPGMRAALASFAVDFNAGESAVLVRPGALPNLGYRISLPQQRLPVTAGTLGVHLRVEPPPPHLLQAQVIGFPCVYLRLANADYNRVMVDVERPAAP